jgi:hypothetical protein
MFNRNEGLAAEARGPAGPASRTWTVSGPVDSAALSGTEPSTPTTSSLARCPLRVYEGEYHREVPRGWTHEEPSDYLTSHQYYYD